MSYIQNTIDALTDNHPNQTEFLQAVQEVLESLEPLLATDKRYHEHAIIERMVEPERQIMFRVPWVDDQGKIQVNKGYRVEFNSALGPYKGGLRFRPSVNSTIMKFLGFEQVLKNALTGLPIGGGKGGANFNPKNHSDQEIMRFCQSFMNELYRHIGPHTDVPAGDIGVGAREIGYLFGQYKRIKNSFDGGITGKGLLWGGSHVRKQATGYGCVYFAEHMMQEHGNSLNNKTCLVSGAGKVAIYTIEKLYELGARPVACSDSTGTLFDNHGIDLETLKGIKEYNRQSLQQYLEEYPNAEFTPVEDYPSNGHQIWRYQAEAAFPCATQNELLKNDAKALINNGCLCICEGANMPLNPGAVDLVQESEILYGPGKAANAGGVAVSQLEMSQNASMQRWSFEEVDQRLQEIMAGVHKRSSETAREFGQEDNLVLGANIAGFRRVADAMIEQGVV